MLLKEEELRRFGETLGRQVHGPVFLGLRGELGAGKSVLARAVARGAGVVGNLPSPTFNLVFRYRGRGGVTVVHMDLYRISDPEEVWELGWEELGRPGEIVLVEWPERAEPHLPKDRWDVVLSTVRGEPGLRRVELGRRGHPPELPSFPMTLEPPGERGSP
ncbi:MAG: tRNA (adenosine(37)-N6)-threonylcarbamoyltransferase complex ATPase subunit type 1 TsaE [Gemmatimonadota bacterium]